MSVKSPSTMVMKLSDLLSIPIPMIRNLYLKWHGSPTLRNISKVYGGDMISKVFAVAMALILIRGMSQVDYAFYISFSAVAALLIGLVGAGINNALVRFSAEYQSSTGKIPYTLYMFALITQIAIFLFLIFCVFIFPAQSAKLLFGKPTLDHLLPVSMLFGLGNILLVSGQSILQSEERFDFYIRTLWIKQGLFFIIVVGLWFFRSLIFQRVAWGLTFAQLVIGIGVLYYSIADIRTINWQEKIREEAYLMRNFLNASGWLIAYFVTLAGFSQMDKLMLLRFASASELANYGVAFQYYSFALLLLGSILTVLTPKFSRIEMQDPIRHRQFLLKWLQYSAWIGLPVILFIVFGKPIFIFLNGIQYEHSFGILAILSVGVWLSLMLSPLVTILISRKEFRFLFLLAANAFLISLVLFYIGVRNWGGLGAAVVVILVNNVAVQIPILWRVYYE